MGIREQHMTNTNLNYKYLIYSFNGKLRRKNED